MRASIGPVSLACPVQCSPGMGAIDNFLRRWGYTKLDRYGLVVTPEGRVISTRPSVLDDGLGGKIVGWLEGDLAAMELEPWGGAKKRKPKRISAPAGLHKAPPAPPAQAAAPIAAAPIAPAPVAPTVSAPAPIAAPAPVAAPAPAPAPVVAAAEEPEEDDWEWEIAMARARAAADEAEPTRANPPAFVASAMKRRTHPGMAVIASAAQPRKPEPDPLPPWPGTEPYNDAWADRSEVAPQVMSVLQKKLAVARSTPARGAAVATTQPAPAPAPARAVSASPRSTVIPVPHLPTVSDPRMVRPAPYTPSRTQSRAARGTAKLEETVRTNAVPPANDDHTAPYIELPNEVKPSGFAHTRRVAAKQR